MTTIIMNDQMHDQQTRLIRFRRERAGLTVLEFVGCLVAVVGGALLGAIYLGVDVRHVAHSALAQVELLDKLPPEWRPQAPSESTMTREQVVDSLRQELGSLRGEIAALQRGDETATPAATSDPLTAAREKTRAYWLRLSEITLGASDLQRDAETASNESNAAKVFAIKARVNRFAANAIDAIPTQDVDAGAVQFGRQLGQWYGRGGELYQRAVQIWESPSQARAKLNDEWRAADLDHRNEAKLLRERAASVRASISRQFGEEFPEFARPDRFTAATATE